MQKITPSLWYDGNAEDAVKFYRKVFKNFKVLKTAYYGEAGPGKKGAVMTISFKLNGMEFLAINGGPQFKFNPSISFIVNCKTQKEIDYYWKKLTDGGKEVQCGWLEDKFGMSWQITPVILDKLIADKNPDKAERVMKEMLTQVKLDIKKLTDAYKGR